jgi:hypothetical protein
VCAVIPRILLGAQLPPPFHPRLIVRTRARTRAIRVQRSVAASRPRSDVALPLVAHRPGPGEVSLPWTIPWTSPFAAGPRPAFARASAGGPGLCKGGWTAKGGRPWHVAKAAAAAVATVAAARKAASAPRCCKRASRPKRLPASGPRRTAPPGTDRRQPDPRRCAGDGVAARNAQAVGQTLGGCPRARRAGRHRRGLPAGGEGRPIRGRSHRRGARAGLARTIPAPPARHRPPNRPRRQRPSAEHRPRSPCCRW